MKISEVAARLSLGFIKSAARTLFQSLRNTALNANALPALREQLMDLLDRTSTAPPAVAHLAALTDEQQGIFSAIARGDPRLDEIDVARQALEYLRRSLEAVSATSIRIRSYSGESEAEPVDEANENHVFKTGIFLPVPGSESTDDEAFPKLVLPTALQVGPFDAHRMLPHFVPGNANQEGCPGLAYRTGHLIYCPDTVDGSAFSIQKRGFHPEADYVENLEGTRFRPYEGKAPASASKSVLLVPMPMCPRPEMLLFIGCSHSRPFTSRFMFDLVIIQAHNLLQQLKVARLLRHARLNSAFAGIPRLKTFDNLFVESPNENESNNADRLG